MSQFSTPFFGITTDDNKFFLTFASLTFAQAKISRHPDGGMMVTAPARVFRLGALTSLAESVAVAVAHSTNIDPSLLIVEAGLHVSNDKMCRAVASVSAEVALQPEVARLAVITLLEHLKGKSSSQSSGTFLTSNAQLDSTALTLIEAIAKDRLAAVGGSAISYPCAVFLNGTQFAELSGQFGPKPAPAADQVVGLEGVICNGFERDVRCVTFILADGTKLRAYWANDQAYQQVKKLALEDERAHSLAFKVTADQNGRPVHTILFDQETGC